VWCTSVPEAEGGYEGGAAHAGVAAAGRGEHSEWKKGESVHGPSEVRRALAGARDALLARPNVVATGIGFREVAGERTGEIAIVCSVSRKVARAQLTSRELVPASVKGVRTDVVETGVLRALTAPTGRFRPAIGGVSVGHVAITAGTLGCVVRRDGERYILSNNHVLADENRASIGDAIVQPGPFDGGRVPIDAIAVLADFVPVRMTESASGCRFARAAATAGNAIAALLGSDARSRAISAAAAENLVDAAIARPLEEASVSEEILGLGVPAGPGTARLGTQLRKSGRTTGVTTGEVVQTDVTADVVFGAGTARFTDQLMAGAMSAGGDSGSAVLDDGGRVVGLLFAGSDRSTLLNRIEHVQTALGVEL